MSRTDPLADHVHCVISRLQDGALRNRASAVTALARLRRASMEDPTADPSVYQVIFENFPEHYRYSECATSEERAAHVAACLFAQHQQSQSQHMHRVSTSRTSGYGLGAAMRRLAQTEGTVEPGSPTVRRFNTLVTAEHEGEIIHHMRSLISLLRSKSLALDYGRLARDLADLFSTNTDRRQRVQLAWARDFSRPTPSATESDTSGAATTTTNQI